MLFAFESCEAEEDFGKFRARASHGRDDCSDEAKRDL